VRSNIVFAVLVVTLGAFVGVLFVRHRVPAQGGAPVRAASASASASAPASVAARGSASAAPHAPAESASATPSLGRPLRVVALGWDLAAAGLVANHGLAAGDKQSRFGKAGLDVALSVVDSPEDVERALARGGADKAGADVALLPLPRFVASFEHLKALDPEMFLVTGWSSGREMLESRYHSLAQLPAKGGVKLGAAPGSSAAFLGLFALDMSGVGTSRVQLVSPSVADADLVAVEWGRDERDAGTARMLFGTGDALHLVPFVAVAQRSMIEKHRAELVLWSRIWLAATKDVAADASGAARRVAAEKGAPEPLALLTRLGQGSRETLAGNAEQLGLSGRGAVTLDSLFQLTWRLWRGVQLLGTPAPEQAPLDGDVVAALVRSAKPSELQEQERPASPAAPAVDAGAKHASPAAPPLVYRQPGTKPDVDALLPTAGLLAGVFPRSPIQLTLYRGVLPDKKATKAAVDRIAERYGIASDRLSAGHLRHAPRSTAAVAVLPAE